MSELKNKIIKTFEKYNMKVKNIDWMPLGKDFEMCGREGGWQVETEDGEFYLAPNGQELINQIETKFGNHSDIKLVQKYCNHIGHWIDQYDHLKGIECCICHKKLE